MNSLPESVKHAGDAVAGAITTAAFFGWISNATAVLALIYLLIRVCETKTVRALASWLRAKLSRV